MRRGLMVCACAASLLLALAGGAQTAEPARPWMNPKLSPDARADLVLKDLTFDEQIGLLHGHFPTLMGTRKPPHIQQSAGWVPGVPRLGIPDLTESDASLGVANAGRKDDDATPLPSGVALAATWDVKTAFDSGAMIGKQARQKGFNVLLNGGVNLLRDPRNGRNSNTSAKIRCWPGRCPAPPSAASSRTTWSRPPSTSPSMTRRPGGWCWTRSSTKRRSARATCWPSRSPSRPASRAR